LKGTETSNTEGKRIFHYWLSPETFGYTLVFYIFLIPPKRKTWPTQVVFL